MNMRSPIAAQAPALIASATIPPTSLKRAAKILRHIRGSMHRCVVPVLSYARLTIAGDHVTLEATDLDQRIALTLEAATEGAAVFLINIETLHGVAMAADGPVTISLAASSAKTLGPSIWMATGDLTIHARNLIPAEDYPAHVPGKGAAVAWSMTPDALLRMLRLSRHCISAEETRYYLNGVFFTNRPDSDQLRVVATDGHRLAVIDSGDSIDLTPVAASSSHHPGVIVPTCAVDTLMRLLTPGGNVPVELKVQGLHISIAMPGFDYDCKLVDGTFPDYLRVIPKAEPGAVTTLSRGLLLRLQRALSGARSRSLSQAAALDPETKTIAVNAGNDTVAAPCPVTVQTGATPERTGFNLGYLVEQGNVTPTFTITVARPGDPAIILGDDPDTMFVLMPMRV